jgi:hypothetical protein
LPTLDLFLEVASCRLKHGKSAESRGKNGKNMMTTKNKCGAKDHVKKDELDSWETIFSESEQRIEKTLRRGMLGKQRYQEPEFELFA